MAVMINFLFVLIGVTAVLSLASTVYIFQSDFPISLQVNGEVWTRQVSEFAMSDRLVVFTLIELASLPWFWALFNMWRLAGLYKGSQYFTQGNSKCFVNIGVALIIMAALQTSLAPVASWYLYSRDVIDGLADWDISLIFLSETDLLTAGLFFLLVGTIMEKASKLQEEADMTI
jgi:hypothetical protein